MPICERCGKEHDGSYGTGRFCSKYCANVRPFPKEVRDKISQRNRKYFGTETRICERCGKPFEVDLRKDSKRWPKRFCSPSCANTHNHTQETKDKISAGIKRYIDNGGDFNGLWKSGGSQHSHGKFKCGYYKNFWCDSIYELVFLIYCLDHNISIQRCSLSFTYTNNGRQHKYIPDFQCGHKNIIELKGQYTAMVDLKRNCIPDKYNYVVLYKQDLKKCFDYVCNKYNVGKKLLYTLYENKTVQKYTYTCSVCGKQFETYYKTDKEYKTCSKRCAGMVKHIKEHNNIKVDYILDKYK